MMQELRQFLLENDIDSVEDPYTIDKIIALSNDDIQFLNTISYFIAKKSMLCFLSKVEGKAQVDKYENIKTYFPWFRRIKRLKKFTRITNLRTPSLKRNWINYVSRSLLIVWVVYSFIRVFNDFDLFIAGHPFITIIGVFIGATVVPVTLINAFAPFLLQNNEFDGVMTLDDLINDIALINRPNLINDDRSMLIEKVNLILK